MLRRPEIKEATGTGLSGRPTTTKEPSTEADVGRLTIIGANGRNANR